MTPFSDTAGRRAAAAGAIALAAALACAPASPTAGGGAGEGHVGAWAVGPEPYEARGPRTDAAPPSPASEGLDPGTRGSPTSRPGDGHPRRPPWFCGGEVEGDTVPAADAPSRDLYCVELLATARGGPAAGTAQLAPAASPFGAPLTRDGRFRYRLSLHLDDLPEPSDLGPYRTWVAWAAAPNLRPMVRLGEVGEGLNHLGTVELSKFLVLVTAERTVDLEARRGPVVLRAQSPSMRLQPHEVPFGFMRGEAADEGGRRDGDGAGGKRAAGGDGGAPGAPRAGPGTGRSLPWTPPPMHPEVPMVPPVRSLLPSTGAYLPDGAGPGAPGASALPEARPPGVERLEDGDTLRLSAQRVRKTLGGRTYVMYGYNGQLPGPLIRVPQDAEITVLFENRIGQPSTVHWHGVRLENRFDGAPGVTQEPVEPGESFVYRVRFPDAGLYWYHPHHREDVQQDLGLYGNMLVEPAPGAEGPGPSLEGRGATRLRERPAGEDFTYGGHFAPVDREEVLQLDDLLVASGSPATSSREDDRAPAAPADRDDPQLERIAAPGPGPLVPYGADAVTHALMGRFGNLMLVNGRTDHRVTVGEGEVVRFYLTNVAGTRTFNLSFGDLPVKVVASDLSRYERPVKAPNVVVAPAERYVVEVRFDEPGTVPLTNRVQALNHIHGYFFPEVDTLATIEVEPRDEPDGAPGDTGDAQGREAVDDGGGGRPDGGAGPDRSGADVREPTAAFDTLAPNPGVQRDVDRYRDAFDRPVDHTLELVVEADSLPFPVGSLVRKDSVYFHPVEAAGTMPRMNWLTTSDQVRWILRDPDTGAENMEIDWRFRVGDVVKIRLRNRRDALHAMQHPIHVHGQRFLVISRNGRRAENLAWKDTALVPAGTTATLLLELTNPGEWMVHCHVSEHLGAGMKATFEVEPSDDDGS